MTDDEVRADVALLEDMLEQLDGEAVQTVAVLLRVYGEALRRIASAAAAGNDGVALTLTRDELVSHLLAVHDLAPAEAMVSPAIAYGPVLLA